MTLAEEKQAAVLTPRGRGAVAVIALRGTGLSKLMEACFEPMAKRPYTAIQERPMVYGTWKESGEDLLIVRPEQTDAEFESLEIQCHGGRVAIESILKTLTKHGVAVTSSATFQTHVQDRWEVETQMALAQCETERTARFLLQLMKIQNRFFAELRSKLLASQSEARQQTDIRQRIESMLNWSDFGLHLTSPYTLVFCGRPNVGKSSLSNALAGFERSIVHDQAGTTRDVVSHETAIDGWPVELKDTAGLRSSFDQIESLGVERAREQIDAADLNVAVLAIDQKNDDSSWLSALDDPIVVINKSDLAAESMIAPQLPESQNVCRVSALTGEGIESLIRQISIRLVPATPDAKQWYPVTAWQRNQLESASEAIERNQWDCAAALLGRQST